MKERYINPFTDFGFKKLFGEEPNKDLLLDFLNSILEKQEGTIVDLTYLKNEHLGRSQLDRKAIFDLYCENDRGEKFIVEMQKSKQKFFKDRSIYYSTFPIQEQAKKSEWNYRLKSIYTIGILDFEFDDELNTNSNPDKYRSDVQLLDIDTHEVFYNKLTFIYFEMPKFTKKVNELDTKFDKWLYVLKNLSKLDRLPERLQESIFKKVFNIAEISKFSEKEYVSYQDSLKYYRDLKNSLDTAFDEGLEEGMKEGMKEGTQKANYNFIVNSIKKGLSDEIISEIVNLSIEEIKAIRSKI